MQFDRETSTQIVIVTIKDLQGYDPGDFAFRLGENWGVGQKEKNNGVVILVKPKSGNGKGRVFIATGYGLEGVLPDAVVNGAVIDNEMIPYFRQNDYYQGLASGVKVIMDITRGEYIAIPVLSNRKLPMEEGFSGIIPIIIIFVIITIMRSRRFILRKNLPYGCPGCCQEHSHRGLQRFFFDPELAADSADLRCSLWRRGAEEAGRLYPYGAIPTLLYHCLHMRPQYSQTIIFFRLAYQLSLCGILLNNHACIT